MLPEGASAAVAYQRVRLTEIRNLYEDLDLDLNYYLNVELDISGRLDSAANEASEVREMLSSIGVDMSAVEPDNTPFRLPKGKSYRRIEPGNPEDFQSLVQEANSYLAGAGVDLEKDPLLQVTGSAEASSAIAAYQEKYGDISWDSSDYLIVTFAGFIATLLDIFLVRIPGDTNFLGKAQQGSPLTKWLKEHSEEIHERFLKRFEERAKVLYDNVRHPDVTGMAPKTHRLQSLGHDPILGFIFGVADILGNTGTYIDKYGDIIKVGKAPTDPVSLTEAFLRVFLVPR